METTKGSRRGCVEWRIERSWEMPPDLTRQKRLGIEEERTLRGQDLTGRRKGETEPPKHVLERLYLDLGPGEWLAL